MAKRSAAERLVLELQKGLGLSPVDARRAAFVVLATTQKGWRKAKIARFLGVTRARVGQRVARLERYATEDTRYPVLEQMFSDAVELEKIGAADTTVAFKPDDWEDLRFADDLLKRVA